MFDGMYLCVYVCLFVWLFIIATKFNIELSNLANHWSSDYLNMFMFKKKIYIFFYKMYTISVNWKSNYRNIEIFLSKSRRLFYNPVCLPREKFSTTASQWRSYISNVVIKQNNWRRGGGDINDFEVLLTIFLFSLRFVILKGNYVKTKRGWCLFSYYWERM